MSSETFALTPEERELDRVLVHALLQRYEIEHLEVPVKLLEGEILRTAERVYHVHPTNLEKLVQSVFSDFFHTEVRHVGQTNDGGVDLIVVGSDSPVMVQVKRRTRARPLESVACVREFLGAMMLQDARRGIFVTTADGFSPQAQTAAQRAITIDKVDEFRLVDLPSFLDMMNVVARGRSPTRHWIPHLHRELRPIATARIQT